MSRIVKDDWDSRRREREERGEQKSSPVEQRPRETIQGALPNCLVFFPKDNDLILIKNSR